MFMLTYAFLKGLINFGAYFEHISRMINIVFFTIQSAEQAWGCSGGALRGRTGPRTRHGGHRSHRTRHEVRGSRRNYSRVSTLIDATHNNIDVISLEPFEVDAIVERIMQTRYLLRSIYDWKMIPVLQKRKIVSNSTR